MNASDSKPGDLLAGYPASFTSLEAPASTLEALANEMNLGGGPTCPMRAQHLLRAGMKALRGHDFTPDLKAAQAVVRDAARARKARNEDARESPEPLSHVVYEGGDGRTVTVIGGDPLEADANDTLSRGAIEAHQMRELLSLTLGGPAVKLGEGIRALTGLLERFGPKAETERWRIDAEHYRGQVESLSAEVARLTSEVAATHAEAKRQIDAAVVSRDDAWHHMDREIIEADAALRAQISKRFKHIHLPCQLPPLLWFIAGYLETRNDDAVAINDTKGTDDAAENWTAEPKQAASVEVERLDYSRFPPGYSGEMTNVDAWAEWKLEHDPPGITLFCHGQLWSWQLDSADEAFEGTYHGAEDARAAAWKWYDRRHAIVSALDAMSKGGYSRANWPRCLTWSRVQVDEVERWLADPKPFVLLPVVLRG